MFPSAPEALTERRVTVVPSVTKISDALLVSPLIRLLADDSKTVQRVEPTKVVLTPQASPRPESPTCEFALPVWPVATSVALAGVAAETGDWGANPSTNPEPTNADKAQSEIFFIFSPGSSGQPVRATRQGCGDSTKTPNHHRLNR